MTTSQNGYTTITSLECRRWALPGIERVLPLNPDHAGFVLAWWAVWFHQKVERIDTGQLDDWGWAPRPIAGSTVISNHASGTACDLNATKHPQGVPTVDTFNPDQIRKIHTMLKRFLGVVRWGGDYVNRPDGMHFEINKGPDMVRVLAYWLARTKRGKQILKANPSYRAPGRRRNA